MSASEKINRLQDLLERVQMRAGEPRTNGATNGHAATSHAVTASAAVAEPAAYDHDEEVMSAAPITPQMAHAQSPSAHPPTAPPPADAGYDYDSDAEVSSEVVEVDIDIDEPLPLESGAQPVAQQTMPPEDLLEEEELEEAPMATQPSVRPEAHEAPHDLEEVTQAAPANEIEEPAPSSSRRPIAGEEPAAEAYEEESAPRHTPPPESGKQVAAAAPSNQPPARKPTSAPPPSLDGHTLIGGWREPGLGGPQVGIGSLTGVRVPGPGVGSAAPVARGGTEPPATVVQPPAAAAHTSGTHLTADVTHPDLAASGEHVVAFEGMPAAPKPKTLGELLDLTLGL